MSFPDATLCAQSNQFCEHSAEPMQEKFLCQTRFACGDNDECPDGLKCFRYSGRGGCFNGARYHQECRSSFECKAEDPNAICSGNLYGGACGCDNANYNKVTQRCERFDSCTSDDECESKFGPTKSHCLENICREFKSTATPMSGSANSSEDGHVWRVALIASGAVVALMAISVATNYARRSCMPTTPAIAPPN